LTRILVRRCLGYGLGFQAKNGIMITNRNSKQMTGKIGETLAAQYLEGSGYQLLHRNWRYGHLEVDLIAFKGNTLHFFEIKTRRTLQYGWPEEHIRGEKIRRIMVAVDAYLHFGKKNSPTQLNILSIVLVRTQTPIFYLIEDVTPFQLL
jgi:putative endonuclease